MIDPGLEKTETGQLCAEWFRDPMLEFAVVHATQGAMAVSEVGGGVAGVDTP